MRTGDFIRLLAADLPSTEESAATAGMKWLPLGLGVAALFFAAAIGFRPGLATAWPVILPKLLVTVTLAGAAGLLAMRLTRPEPPHPALVLVLLAPLGVLSGLLLLEFAREGGTDLAARAIGRNGFYCLAMIPLLSLAPLAAILHAARQGAVTWHRRAGMAAGMAAAGLGASLYALHCTDDSLLFVALWYSLATLVTAGIGAVACRLAVRW